MRKNNSNRIMAKESMTPSPSASSSSTFSLSESFHTSASLLPFVISERNLRPA